MHVLDKNNHPILYVHQQAQWYNFKRHSMAQIKLTVYHRAVFQKAFSMLYRYQQSKNNIYEKAL